MTKKQTADEGEGGDDGAAKRKRGRTPAGKRQASRKPDKPEKKPSAKKPPAKKPPKKKPDEVAADKLVAADGSGEIDVVEVPEDDVPDVLDDIEDAQIIAETPLETSSDTLETLPIVEAANLSDEERELRELYGEPTAPATAHAEFADRQTADEDRPMMPEINARDERKQRWEERRDRRRQRREERGRTRQERQERNQAAQQGRQEPLFRDQRPPRPPGTPPPVPPARPSAPVIATASPPPPTTNGHDHDAVGRVGTPLGDAAATVFAQLRNGQPLPVRQLAAMMRKRSLVETDPEQLAPQLKAELLGDERSYRTLGLRPRIVYRGRDLFAPGPVAMSSTAEAEAGFAAALSRLAGATHRALGQRIAKASPAGFERLIHAYLVAAGYRDIAWVKRIGGISYASATAPGIDRTVLISARSGDQPIDRRGVGELRVGVEAKNLVAGILFSARELSEDAERELERAGRSIAVMCGDQLVGALIASGVGVVSSAAPLHYVDDQLLDELLAG